MKPKHCRWWVSSDNDFVDIKPTRKSADKLAQRCANKTGNVYFYHTAKERMKARKTGKLMKVFLVYPEEEI